MMQTSMARSPALYRSQEGTSALICLAVLVTLVRGVGAATSLTKRMISPNPFALRPPVLCELRDLRGFSDRALRSS
jgi:hypothetical protein